MPISICAMRRSSSSRALSFSGAATRASTATTAPTISRSAGTKSRTSPTILRPTKSARMASNLTFDGNVFHDIGRTDGQTLNHFDHGIYTHASNVTIINNIFYNMNKGFCIQLADGANSMLIANNTFALSNVVTGESGQVMFWGSNSNITLRNNIFYKPTGSAITRFAATISGSAFDHNLVNGVSTIISDVTGFTIGINQIGANPLFVNVSTAPYDFHAQLGGAGIDAGVNLSAVLSDF